MIRKDINNYSFIVRRNKDKNYINVVCSFIYNKKKAKRVILLPKIEGKKNEEYINEAYAHIKTLYNNGNLDKAAYAKSIKHNNNFFIRHKTPLIICGSLLLVGGIAGACVGLLKGINEEVPLTQDQINQKTENYIDSYLSTPSVQKIISDRKQISEILTSVFTNLNDVSSFNYNQLSSNSLHHVLTPSTYLNNYFANNLDKYYSPDGLNSGLRYKKLINTSIKADWYSNDVAIIDANDTSIFVEGDTDAINTIKSKGTIKIHEDQLEPEKSLYTPFSNFKFFYDGYSSANLESNKDFTNSNPKESYEEASIMLNDQVGSYVKSCSFINYSDPKDFIDFIFSNFRIYVAPDKSIYCERDSQEQYCGTIPSMYTSDDIPVFSAGKQIYHIIRDESVLEHDKQWFLESYATDTGANFLDQDYDALATLYTYFNEKGNYTGVKNEVNINKSTVTYKYNKRTPTKLGSDVKFSNIRIASDATDMNFNILDGEDTKLNIYLEDVTEFARLDDKNLFGFKLRGSSNESFIPSEPTTEDGYLIDINYILASEYEESEDFKLHHLGYEDLTEECRTRLSDYIEISDKNLPEPEEEKHYIKIKTEVKKALQFSCTVSFDEKTENPKLNINIFEF